VGQEKSNHILTHVRNQEERIVIERLLGSHNQEIGEMKNVTNARLGRKKGLRPNFVIFTSFAVKLEMLRNSGNLAGSRIRVEDFH
jgi:hypothetical protein